MDNINAKYGGFKKMPFMSGNVFMLATSSQEGYDNLTQMFKSDSDGQPRLFSTWALTLAACTAGRGDIIYVHPGFTTALSAAELLLAETKGVTIRQAGRDENGVYTVTRATGVLAQTADLSIFTITGRVKILQVIGIVTTVVQTQANNTLLKINPTVGADVDLCAALDISADAVGSSFTITGTLANALINTVSGVVPSQASPVIVEAGVIELECAASNTGSVKWMIQYKPIDPGARIFAA